MDADLRKKLELIFKYLEIQGCEYAEKEGDYYSMSLFDHTPVWFCSSKKGNSGVEDEFLHGGNVKLPIDITNEIEVLIDNNSSDFERFGDDPYSFEVRLYPSTKTISVNEVWSEYRERDMESITIDSEDEPEVKEIIDYYCSVDEICRGEITFDIQGGGDSGFIEDKGRSDFNGSVDMSSEAEDMFYRILNNTFGGWEINEGSQGTAVIDMDLETVSVNIAFNEEIQNSDTAWSMTIDDNINEQEEKSKINHTSSVQKLLDLLYFNGLDVNYSVNNYMTQHHGEVYDIDLDIDVSRFFYGSPNYDENYNSVIYDIETMFDKVEKYLGIKNGSIVTGLNYVNSDFLDDEALKASKELQKTLMDRYGFTKEESTNYYLNIYYNDDNPNVELEAIAHDQLADNQKEIIENEVMEVVDKSPILSKFHDIEWWINY